MCSRKEFLQNTSHITSQNIHQHMKYIDFQFSKEYFGIDVSTEVVLFLLKVNLALRVKNSVDNSWNFDVSTPA